MTGTVLDFSVQTGSGIINGDDGVRYRFAGSEWKHTAVPSRGVRVDFEVSGGAAIAVYGALSQPAAYPGVSGKSRSTAAILAILLGGLGIHKFYLGAWGWGLVYLIFCWTYIPVILGVIEGIRYLTLSDEDFLDKAFVTKTPFGFLW